MGLINIIIWVLKIKIILCLPWFKIPSSLHFHRSIVHIRGIFVNPPKECQFPGCRLMQEARLPPRPAFHFFSNSWKYFLKICLLHFKNYSSAFWKSPWIIWISPFDHMLAGFCPLFGFLQLYYSIYCHFFPYYWQFSDKLSTSFRHFTEKLSCQESFLDFQ